MPVFLPGESYGQRGLVGYNPYGSKGLDMTEATEYPHMQTKFICISMHKKRLHG